MRREELTRLLEGAARPAERARLAAELAAPDEASRELLATAWQPGAGPDVFDAAFDAVHPVGPPWWKRWVVVAAAAVLVAVAAWWPVRVDEGGLKGPVATPSLGLVLVALDGATHRLGPDERVAPGTRWGARVTTSQPAWLALEAQRDGSWVRVWPDRAAGLRFEAGEHELGDELGAVVLRAEPAVRTGVGGTPGCDRNSPCATRDAAWELRLVGATQPLDVARERSVVTRKIVVTP